MSAPTHGPPTGPADQTGQDDAWEASLRAKVDRMSSELRRQQEAAEKFETHKKRRRSAVLFPLVVCVGLCVIGMQVWYLTRPLAPPPSPPALTGDKLATANSVAEMIVVEEAVQAYRDENDGAIPASLHEIADTLPDHVRERVEQGGLRLLRTGSEDYVISNDRTTAPAFLFESGRLKLIEEETQP